MKIWIGVEVYGLVVQDVHVFFDKTAADEWFKKYTGFDYDKFYDLETGSVLIEDIDKTGEIFSTVISTDKIFHQALMDFLVQETNKEKEKGLEAFKAFWEAKGTILGKIIEEINLIKMEEIKELDRQEVKGCPEE